MVDRIRRTIERLDTPPAERQRPIFSNLIKFVEIHPMKIKIGMYAPAKEALKATGTDGICVEGTEAQEKEGKLIPFNPTHRVGSSTVGIGAGEANTDALLTLLSYPHDIIPFSAVPLISRCEEFAELYHKQLSLSDISLRTGIGVKYYS